MKKKAVLILLLVFLSLDYAFAQDSKTVSEKQTSRPRLIDLPKPQYIEEAKSAKATGKVEVAVVIDEQGNVISAKAISGNQLLQESAVEAAKKAKFEPTLVEGKPAKVNGIISYNFSLTNYLDSYFQPKTIDELIDVKKTDEHFESLLNLVENYKIGFGFGDKKFHAETNLTLGDFTFFLDKTLKLLDEKSQIANKKTTGIYQSFNSFGVKTFSDISVSDEKSPYFQSVKDLFEKYEIALIDDNNKFNGNAVLSQNEVIRIWREIFGEEALPINFQKIKDGDKAFTRGDFAIFLNESLEVLTYKTLP
ncbi:MAG: energy transducer TonB [Pyrinomonadaceae bacterium]|jgi:TonB family protein|nr:energy transducer TonB [Pyrinomonadaceae bacterium]